MSATKEIKPENLRPRILIVDDEAPQMKALCDTLRVEGYDATGCGSGKEALTAMRSQSFDLLLTDLLMPEMDGIGLLRAAMEVDSNLVAIMMTAHGTIDTAVEAMQAGAYDYILKPFKLSVVLPVLSRALTVRKLRLENAELERRIHERTLELEAANKELEAFSYSVSHDLRAPLRAVDGFAEILLKKYGAEIPPEAGRLLNNVTTGAKQMSQLIEDLLRFSQLGRQPLSEQRIDMAALVQDALLELREANRDRPIEIQVGELPPCKGDQGLLKQVLVNLLSNAFKFTRGKENAKIEVGCDWQKDDHVYFVRDNGTGFDMKHADKLFGVFHRLHNEDQFEGTGVGLSIVQRIIDRHGGRVWVEAEVDKGATFHFILPH